MKSETVDKLLGVSLNADLMNLDEMTKYFVAKKKQTFNDYINNKIKYHNERQDNQSIYNI